jgi:short-subunit dehydrogenase
MKSKNTKVWLVTGASQGLGFAIVKHLLSMGHDVIATTRDPAKFSATGLEAENLHVIGLDLTSENEVKNAVAQIIGTHGRIDVLINNAGFGFIGAIEEASQDEIDKVMAINVFAPIRMVQAVLPYMRAAGSGHIINLSSIAGLAAAAGIGIYNSAKFAVEGFSEALNLEVNGLGIKVTIVEPGVFRTGFYDKSLVVAKKTIPEYDNTVGNFKRIFTTIKGKEPGNPDLAAAAIFDLVNMEHPPLRLLLGKDAFSRAMKKMDDNKIEFERMQQVAVSTDY